MLIRVKYMDNHYDMIRPEVLNHLLEDGSVKSFLRRDGWVTPGLDHMRAKSMGGYTGPERRLRREMERRANR